MSPSNYVRITGFVAGFGFYLILFVSQSDTGRALPAFARKYGTSCTTCHVMVPKLNSFGVAFRNNGFRIPKADEKFVKSPDVSLGAPAWKKVWPKAVWPGAIPSMPPLALRVLADFRFTPSEDVTFDMDMPHELEVYFAGTSGESVGFFGEIGLENDSTVRLGRAFLQFDSLFDKTLLNLKLGRIDLRAEPFPKRRRLSAQSYNVSELRIFPSQPSLGDEQAGVELWGALTSSHEQGGLEYGVGFVNGVPRERETNNFKDYYWTVSYKFGGMGVAGSREVPAALQDSESLTDWSFQLGGFGYVGKWNSVTGVEPMEDRYTRYGFKVDAYLDKLNLFGAALWGRDDIRRLDRIPEEVRTSAYFMEADYVLLPWVVPLLRLEKTDFSDRGQITQVIPAVRMAIRANTLLLVEGRLSVDQDPDLERGNELIVRFDLVF